MDEDAVCHWQLPHRDPHPLDPRGSHTCTSCPREAGGAEGWVNQAWVSAALRLQALLAPVATTVIVLSMRLLAVGLGHLRVVRRVIR